MLSSTVTFGTGAEENSVRALKKKYPASLWCWFVFLFIFIIISIIIIIILFHFNLLGGRGGHSCPLGHALRNQADKKPPFLGVAREKDTVRNASKGRLGGDGSPIRKTGGEARSGHSSELG